ncbi:MAG TPA: FtsX-like permease family protein [Cyclobacteriaceae bacterium]|nr:FtsX-like permease family protein [Cyclobacteriaceae bacterium]
MLRSFFVITLRLLWRNKLISFINIFSLSIGIMAFILIMLYVHHELSYDKFNENYDRIYRLQGDDYGKLPPIIGQYVKDKVPEVENIARLAGGRKQFITLIPEEGPRDLKQVDANIFWADSTTFEVFTLLFIKGDPRSALTEPFTAVLTESISKKLFGDTNPMMKNIEFMDHQFMITGIIEDIQNFHIEIDILFSQESIPKVYPVYNLNHAGSSSWLWSATYLLMNDEIDEKQVEEKINKVLTEINDGNLFDLEFKHFHLSPLKDIYFSGSVQNLPYGLHGNLKLIRIFIAVAIFVLALACINYINLTTARATLRLKEVAMKKVAGSSRIVLGYQFIIESVMITFISFLLAFTLIQTIMPLFKRILMVNINLTEMIRPETLILVALGVLLLGGVAGFYPALYFTSLKTGELFKGERMKATKGIFFRHALMTIQFIISIVLIIGIISNHRQLNYARNLDLGFNKDQIITVNTPGDFPEMYTLRESFKDMLLQHHEIFKVSFSAGNPGSQFGTSPVEIDGIKKVLKFFMIDPDYIELMDIKILKGRNFSWDNIGERLKPSNLLPTDKVGIIFNETAIKKFGIDSTVGKTIYWTDRYNIRIQLEIIGIVRDFHFRSFHHEIEPLVLVWGPPMVTANIKVNASNIYPLLRMIEADWKNVYGNRPFVYQFLDETFYRQYKSDEQLATVIRYFTGIAILIACMGLFALSSFMVAHRTKEIGIRKTMGATIKTIYIMLSWDFLKWILLAAVIACPIAWYLMDKWLQGFAYHIKLGVDIFIIAVLIAVGIALLTITWQALKTARANPVEALKYE